MSTYKTVVWGNGSARVISADCASSDMLAVRNAFAAVMVSGEQLHGMIAMVGDPAGEQRFAELTAQTFPGLGL